MKIPKTPWLLVSNRYKHLAGGIAVGLGADTNYCAAYAGIGIAGAMEYKDKASGGQWDWIDFGCTVAGVIIGRTIRIILWN